MNPAVVKLLLVLVAAAAAFAGGWAVRGWKADSEQLDAVRAEAKKYADNVDALAAALQEISIVREKERQRAALDRTAFQRRLNDATQSKESLVECQPQSPVAAPAGPAGDVRFMPGFVRLWNEALDIRLPEVLRTGGTESPGTGPDLPTVEEVLANHAANAEACNELRARALTCKAYIERLESLP